MQFDFHCTARLEEVVIILQAIDVMYLMVFRLPLVEVGGKMRLGFTTLRRSNP